jgi:hypothetical protein
VGPLPLRAEGHPASATRRRVDPTDIGVME